MSNQTDLVALSQGNAAGLTPLAGSVVQAKYAKAASSFSTSSGSWTPTGLQVLITPKTANSTFFASFSCRIVNSYGSYIEFYSSIFLNGQGVLGTNADQRVDTGAGSVLHTWTGVVDVASTSQQTFEVYMAQGYGTSTGFRADAMLYVQEIAK